MDYVLEAPERMGYTPELDDDQVETMINTYKDMRMDLVDAGAINIAYM